MNHWLPLCAGSLVMAFTATAAAHPPGPGEGPHDHTAVAPPAGAADAAEGTSEDAATVPPASGDAAPGPRERVATAARRPPPAERTYSRRRTIENNSWRQRARDQNARSSEWIDTKHFHFELRFGPYWAEVDEAPLAPPDVRLFPDPVYEAPYEKFFGTDARFYFGLEIDWLPIRIPYVGALGAAFGWGYTSASADAVISFDENGNAADRADSETSFSIMPMHVSAALRIDGPLVRWNVPVAPYLKLGLGIAPWSTSDPDSTDQDTTMGMHLAIGGAIALNAFDPTAAVSLREDTGIGYAYLFGEWMWANLDGIGSGEAMHVGTSTAVVGVALDW